MVRFLAEVAQRHNSIMQLTPTNSKKTGTNAKITRQNNIYELDVNTPPEESYWINWGGRYDNIIGNQIFLYFGRFLPRVVSYNDLLQSPYSMFIENGIAYVNLPNHPWLYSGSASESESVVQFLSVGLNADNPSNNIIREESAQVKLKIPSVTVKLSGSISGIILNQIFQISLHNNNGYFDDDTQWNLFNTPVYLKKSIKENPKYEDFKTIRSGLAESITTGFDSFSIEVSDKQRSMDAPVCNVINVLDFPPNILIDEKSLNKNIPIVYGTKKIKLIKLNKTQYFSAEYVSNVYGVYNKEGEEQTYSFNSKTNIITSYSGAETAVIRGYPSNKISEIIRDILERKAYIYFNETNWNTLEYERYNETAFSANVEISSGNIKSTIQNILKSDMAFLIQQNDGRFSIRRYGTEYKTHIIPSWAITKQPEKTWSDAQNEYFSSCVINYDFEGDEYKSYLFADREYWAEDMYRRHVVKTYDTDLFNAIDAKVLAERLSDRYSEMKQTLKLPVGIDTADFELLDRVICGNNINNRKFSCGEYFIIKGIDLAQDILTLEEITLTNMTGEYPYTDEYLYDVDGLYSYTLTDEYKYLVEGGTQ